MTTYQLISDYKKNDVLRQSFFDLALKSFQLDLETWFQAGAWDESYICYSYVDDQQVIANVSVTLMTIHFDGQLKKAVQLGTVMTASAYRNQGLAAKLIQHILRMYQPEVELHYLFANKTVLDFYPKFGFEAVQENQLTIDVVTNQLSPIKATYRKLVPTDLADAQLLQIFAEKRRPNSLQLGVSQNPSLMLLYFHSIYPDNLYYFEEAQTIIIAEQTEQELTVIDLVQIREHPLAPLIEQLLTDKIQTVTLLFMTDSQELEIQSTFRQEQDGTLFMLPVIKPPTQQLLFPKTSHS